MKKIKDKKAAYLSPKVRIVEAIAENPLAVSQGGMSGSDIPGPKPGDEDAKEDFLGW